jgi:glycosyltransferase involved in cell wall biosynthesis|tara:strand:+ start:876 stop:1541 length:666 start_codon:yes stop_codon:yes gene_type:complete
MDNLTLVIPAKYEKESLPSVLKELEKYNTKITIVLEESDKETISSIKEFNCNVLFQKGKGYGDALIQGINSVETEYFCIFNADGSFKPEELNGMLDLSTNHNYDLIFGSRYEQDSSSEDDTLITFIGNKIFSLIGKIFFSLPISDILYTFVLGKTKEVNDLNLTSKDFCFCVELPIKAYKNNLNLISSPANERKRIAGTKKVNAFKDGFKILISMIKLKFS